MIVENEANTEIEDTETEDITGTEVEVNTPPSPALAIVQAALDKNAVGVTDAFNALVQNKLSGMIDQRKQELANSLVTPDDQQPTEENPDDDEDFVSDEPETEENPQEQEDSPEQKD